MPAHFRIVTRGPDGVLDTTPVTVNRFAVPHRSADTFRFSGGGSMRLGFVPFDGTKCRTFMDSLWTWMPLPTDDKVVLIKLP